MYSILYFIFGGDAALNTLTKNASNTFRYLNRLLCLSNESSSFISNEEKWITCSINKSNNSFLYNVKNDISEIIFEYIVYIYMYFNTNNFEDFVQLHLFLLPNASVDLLNFLLIQLQQ